MLNLLSLQRDLLHMNTELVEKLDRIVELLEVLVRIEEDRDARMKIDVTRQIQDAFYGDGK